MALSLGQVSYLEDLPMAKRQCHTFSGSFLSNGIFSKQVLKTICLSIYYKFDRIAHNRTTEMASLIVNTTFRDQHLTIDASIASEKFELCKIPAANQSSVFSQIVDILNPTRVTIQINNPHAKQVSVRVNDLAAALEISWLILVLCRIFYLFTFENFVQSQLVKSQNEKIANVLAKGLASKYPKDGFKISKKQFKFLTHSFVALRLNDLQLYRKEQAFLGKDHVIGEGGFKRAKEITQKRRPEVLVTPKVATPEAQTKLSLEIELHGKFKDSPHIAKGIGVTWISRNGIKKMGILMPKYPFTMSKIKGLSFREKKRCVLHAALAIQALFERDYLHFDLKPDNIFIDFDETGKARVWVGDLGGVRKFTSLLSDLGTGVKRLFGFASASRNNIADAGYEYTAHYHAPTAQLPVYDKKALTKNVVYSFAKTMQEWLGADLSSDPRLTLMLRKALSTHPENRPDITEIIQLLS